MLCMLHVSVCKHAVHVMCVAYLCVHVCSPYYSLRMGQMDITVHNSCTNVSTSLYSVKEMFIKSVSIQTRLWSEQLGFNSWKGQTFFSSPMSRPVLRLTQPPVQQMLEAFSEVKKPEHKLDYMPPLNAKVKNACSCTSIPLYIFTA